MRVEYSIFHTEDIPPEHRKFITGPGDYPHALYVSCQNDVLGYREIDDTERNNLELTVWLERNMIGSFHREKHLLFLSSKEDLIVFKMAWG